MSRNATTGNPKLPSSSTTCIAPSELRDEHVCGDPDDPGLQCEVDERPEGRPSDIRSGSDNTASDPRSDVDRGTPSGLRSRLKRVDRSHNDRATDTGRLSHRIVGQINEPAADGAGRIGRCIAGPCRDIAREVEEPAASVDERDHSTSHPPECRHSTRSHPCLPSLVRARSRSSPARG
ncbi:hypothetical protein CWS96_gp30 [Saline Natrinema sp. J7-1 virus 1]|uniref:Uncharacterized protein n=1 Tax=Saline Natrinema sp. J7-1 virus 1 TaxID=2847285 RepID=A0AAF0AK33_9VIRU|nr:hypothetical protein CWS96_gp30 [Saline Natrinema sp. J7-1 virus 1]WBE14035.1 hypothetical protein [Saline Natrinema sp. J7-1 virus 1]